VSSLVSSICVGSRKGWERCSEQSSGKAHGAQEPERTQVREDSEYRATPHGDCAV